MELRYLIQTNATNISLQTDLKPIIHLIYRGELSFIVYATWITCLILLTGFMLRLMCFFAADHFSFQKK